MDYKKLVEMAYEAMENAYVPYSNFNVGAALLGKSGKVYTGCNVECASYGGTNCAERTALFKAVSEGEREFTAIAVVSRTRDITPPCGICRQVLAEFGTDMDVIVAKDLDYEVYNLSELLPLNFTSDELDK
jgi:cytidine deaminase